MSRSFCAAREALKATHREIQSTGRRCVALSADMSREDQWSRIVDETVSAFGGLDVLVYGAATAEEIAPIIQSTSDGWDLVMRVNLKGAFMVSKLCHPHMKSRGGGSVIHITSNECFRPSFGLVTYSISKGAMVTMTQVCAKEWAGDKIRVNCIAPGLVRTELAEPLVKMVETSGRYPNPLKTYRRASRDSGYGAIPRKSCWRLRDRADICRGWGRAGIRSARQSMTASTGSDQRAAM